MSFVEQRKRKHGDRKDGHFIKDLPPINKIMIQIYPNRCDSEVSSTMDLDITNLMLYIKKRKEIDPNCNIKFFHCFIAALTRTINERPHLLRFISNYKMYQKDEIRISFVAKRKFNDKSGEAVINYVAKKDDNVDKISDFIIKTVNGERDETQIAKQEEANMTIDSLKRMPHFVMRLLGFFLRKFDKHGWLPKSITGPDPSFATAMVANLGSIGSRSVYHHLNNYGTCSMMITIGKIIEKEIKNDDGSVSNKTFVDVTATFDERIADGFYFLKSMELMQNYLNHPEVLEKPFEEEIKL